MKLMSLIAFLMIFNLSAQSETKLNQSLCNGATLLITPKIIQLPEGYAIKIVSTLSANQPYVLVEDIHGQYEANIISQGKSENKFIGYILINEPKISLLLVDGCKINLEMKL
ncbi:MAG: hypothetical protein U9N52_13785 [Campylobacterota bacterium]|nr:hypothetical protein [Campylobacterota bacterium]